jgi:hypothetical protein
MTNLSPLDVLVPLDGSSGFWSDIHSSLPFGIVSMPALSAPSPMVPMRGELPLEYHRQAEIMGRPAEDIEHEVFLVRAGRFRDGKPWLSEAHILKMHGQAQAFYDAANGIDWPTNDRGLE